MNRAWLLRGAIALAVALLVTWIARNTYWDDATVPNFPSGQAATNPFYTAERLAVELGATSEWRKTWGDPPAQDAVLFLSQWNWDLIPTRRRAIERWVESGGRLILDETLSSGGDAFVRWSGLEARSRHEVAQSSEQEADDTPIEPQEPCRDLTIRSGDSQLSDSRETYLLCGLAIFGDVTSVSPPQWSLEDTSGLQVVRANVGRGSVTLINGEPFKNRQLLMVDNPSLFADALQLKKGDHVVFASEQKRASLLQLIWMYGAPAVMLGLAVIALALWRGSVRFGPLEAAPDSARRSLAEMIRGTGQFAWRIGGGRSLHSAMVRALEEAALLRIPRYELLPRDEKIAAIARVAQVDTELLAQSMNFGGHRRAPDFKNTIAILNGARDKVLRHDRRHASIPPEVAG